MCFTIHSTGANGYRDDNKNWMEEFISEGLNPVLRVRIDGKLLYTNRAGVPFLKEWGLNAEEKSARSIRETYKGALHKVEETPFSSLELCELPSEIMELVRKTAFESRPETLEIEVGGRLHSLTFTPSGGENVVISALDITSLRDTETELRMREKQHEALFRLGEIALSSISLQALLDETVLLVASTLGVEYCKILKILPDGDFLLQAGANRKVTFGKKIPLHREAYSRAGSTLLSVKEEDEEAPETRAAGTEAGGRGVIDRGLFFGPDFFRKSGLVSGMSVTINTGKKPCGVIAVHSRKKREFRKEDVYFLNSVAALISGTIERRNGEKALLDKVNFLECLLNAIPAPVFYKDRGGIYRGCNELFARQVLGRSREDVQGRSVEELSEAIPEDLGRIYTQMDRELLKNGGHQFYESKVMCADGLRREFMFSKATYGDVSGGPEGLVGVMQDISGRKAAEKKLQKSEERYRSFIQNFKGIFFKKDLEFNPLFIQGAVEEITGYGKEEFISGKVRWLELVLPEDRPRILENRNMLITVPNLLLENEYRIRHRNGKIRWVCGLVQNTCEAAGKITSVQGSIYDINEKKAAEEALAKTEEIRKKEIHHRIKNNLQVVSSLLFLQSEKFNDEEVVEAFRESEQRVISMALIHEELYRSGDVESIDFTAYLQKLTADLLSSYKVGNEEIRLLLDVEAVSFGIDTAVPLGIIVNELFSNSLKYAFPGGTGGEIYIGLRRKNADENENENENEKPGEKEGFILTFSDNGVGFPEKSGFGKAAKEEIDSCEKEGGSLGLKLINALVDQLEGSIEIERERGSKFVIRFRDIG